MQKLIIVLILWGSFCVSFAQQIHRPFHIQKPFLKPNSLFLNDTVMSKTKNKAVTGIAIGGYAAFGVYLGGAWYSKEDLGPFHFFDDWHEWQQLDKAGHMYGGYHASKWMIDLYKWSGMPKKRAIWQGGLMGFAAMSSIEVFDGFGKKWGASVSDIGANALGSSLIMVNQALWNEDRIQRKYSYLPSVYTRSDSVAKYGDALGSNIQEFILKDYNGQIHWISVRVHSFLPEGNFKDHYPRWLNLAVGYGGSGMIGRYYNANDPGNPYDPQWMISQREYRKYFLALDIDLANIRTRSGVLNAIFQTANMIHIPLPALELDRFGGRFRIR